MTDHLTAAIDDLEMSEEGLTSVLRGFQDYVSRLKANMKGVLFRNKGFQRTELQIYTDSHPRRIKTFFKEKSYFDFSKIAVPVPDTFSSTFRDFGQDTMDLLKRLDPDLLTSETSALMETLTTGDPKARTKACQDFNRKVSKVSARDLKRVMDRHFSRRQKKPDLPAGEVLGSFRQLKDMYDNVLAFRSTYQKVTKVVTTFETIDDQIDRLITTLEEEKSPDRVFLRAFHDSLKLLEVQLLVFGGLIENLTRLEYTFTRGFRKIVDASFRT